MAAFRKIYMKTLATVNLQVISFLLKIDFTVGVFQMAGV